MDTFLGSVEAMTSSQQQLGRWGETFAANYLVKKGYRIIERNLRNPYGEIDLIAQKKMMLVFVEVKTRTTDSYGFPEASITPQKQEHLIAAAQAYLQSSPLVYTNWRIDVIAIRKLKSSRKPEIIHFENAIT